MSADERTGNLLGALALTLADHIGTGSDAAALITLRNYAEGEPLDLLRRALALSHPGVVRLADRLERRGLVERRRSERDGRAVVLQLTRAGRRAATEAQRARAQAIDTALGSLQPAERRSLEGMLERMLAAHTTDATASLVICRLCDPDVCGHPDGCPVTQAAIAAAPAP
jgi:MarR family transcriptional regulator, negative regulator of the multidrug operon emrRAB